MNKKLNKIIKYMAFSFSLVGLTSCLSKDFNYFVKNTQIYDFSVLVEKLGGEELDIAIYNKIFIEGNNEEYHYAINEEHDDDNVAGEIPKVSEVNTITEEGLEDFETYDNQLFILGRLAIAEEYDSFIFKFEDYGYEYINLNTYTKEGQLLSAICLFFKKKEGKSYTYSELKSNKEIWQYTIPQESIEEKIYLKIFRLEPDGHFRVIKEIPMSF